MAKENEFEADSYIKGDHNENFNFVTHLYTNFFLPDDQISNREVCERRNHKKGDI